MSEFIRAVIEERPAILEKRVKKYDPKFSEASLEIKLFGEKAEERQKKLVNALRNELPADIG